MPRLLRTVLPTSRLTLALWAWRNRYMLLDWVAFGLRAVGDAARGRGTGDARAELGLRSALIRDPMTRGLAVEVRVERGVLTLTGRVSPQVHARLQDKAVAIPGIKRINDRLVTVSPRNRRFRLRAA